MNIAWIIVALIALVLIAVIALVVGLWLRKKNQISLSAPEEKRELTQQERSGNYLAGTDFNFTTASGEALGGVGLREREPEPRPQQSPYDKPRSGAQAASTDPAAADPGVAPADSDTRADLPDAHGSAGLVTGAKPEASDAEHVAPTAADAAPDAATQRDAVSEADQTQKPEPKHKPEPTPNTATATPAPAQTPAPAAGEAHTTEVGESLVREVAPPSAEQREQIAAPDGRMHRLRGRLSRSNNTVGRGLLGLLGAGDLDEESWEEIEDTLIMADLGTATTTRVVERLRADIASHQVRTEAQVRELLRNALIDHLHPEMDRSIRALPHQGKPAVILVVGVNGTGKTTTTGKLARVLVAGGRKILLGAADTFRAAAADQLQTWGERVGAETVRGKEAADPAAVAFDAVARGIDTGVDAVLVDTAGRLHTKVGLMDQLGKVKRVVEKKAKVDEVLLVIDATTGQNGLAQARVFRDVVEVTGVVLTKLDGTAKGGIVFQVQHELGVPVKLVGLGEGADDLAPFVPEAFVDALLA